MRKKIFTFLLAIAVSAGTLIAQNSTNTVGVFSVSATRKVAFSPGNLQYNAAQGSHQCADGTTKPGTWRFAEHQWDYVGSANENVSSSYNGWIDLFGWGTSGWNNTENDSYAVNYNPWSTSASKVNSTYNYYGYGPSTNQTDKNLTGTSANYDWGVYNQIGNDAPGSWRTLTKDEWGYLFHGRTNYANLFGLGKVNGVQGTIILPDSWVAPVGLTFTPSTGKGLSWRGSDYYDSNGGHYSDNTYTSSQWELMESAGAVFLPAAGYRSGTTVLDVRTNGDYWSSTQNGTSYAYDLYFHPSWLEPQDGSSRYIGFSVRLVRAAQNEQEPVYSLSVSVEGEGTVTGAGEYKNGTTATLTATAASGYTFSQWSDGNTNNPRTITVTQNMTLTAVFAKNTFLISFVNYDGTELQSSEVEYGETPVYTDAIPIKPADEQYTYSFSGWTPEIVAVTDDATYTAQFTSTLNMYAITFVNYDGSELQSSEVAYGETPVYTGETPIKPADAQYTYSFSGWDADLVAVTGEATYTAMFASLPIASSNSIFIHNGENPNLCDLGAQNFSHIIIEPGGELNINQSCVHVEAITIISTGVKSGQIHHGNNPIPTDRIFMEYVLNPVGENASPNLWYAFAVPFEVDIETGITRAYGNKNHVSGTDFLVKEFDGSLRATTGKGWKSKLTGTLEPGRFYVIGIDGNCNRWLFEKTSEAAFEGDNHMNIYYYSANNAKNNGWNGMGNTQLEYTTMDLSNLGIEYILTYNSQFDKYDIGLVSESSLCVGQPFIIQTPVAGEFDFIHGHTSSAMPALYADRQTLKPLMHFTLADETQSTGIDHMYLTMHDDATPAYTIGRDVTRMSNTCTTAAQLWCTTEDGVQLSAHGIEMPTNSTTVNLELFAPAAGEYLLSMASRAMDGYEVELLYNGTWVATLNNGLPLTLTLNSGVNNGYALRITRHNVPTDLESITPSDAVNGEKRIIDGVLYILHNGRMYDAQGKQLKDN